MKLPDKVQSGVQNLTMKDINRPMRIAGALGQLAAETGKAVDSWKSANDNIDMLGDLNLINREYNSLNMQLNQSKVINLDDGSYLTESEANQIVSKLGVEPMKNAQGQRILPSYEVSGFIHDKFVEETRKSYMSKYSRSSAVKIDKAFTKATIKNGNKLIQNNYKQRLAVLNEKYTSVIDENISTYNLEGAQAAIQSGIANGVIDYDQGVKAFNELPERIEKTKIQDLIIQGLPDTLLEAEEMLVNKNNLSEADEWLLFTRLEAANSNYDSDINREEKKVSAEI